MPEDPDRTWKEKIDVHDAKLESLEDAARRPCFSKAEFNERLSVGDDWQKLIQAHLYLEFIASAILEAELPNPKEISLSRMGFSARLDLITAMGLVPIEFVTVVRKVARMRNGVAHDLSFQVTERQVADLRNSLPKWLRDVAEEEGLRLHTGPLSLHELLRATVLYFEMFRQERAVWNARQSHSKKRISLAQGFAKHVLNTTSSSDDGETHKK